MHHEQRPDQSSIADLVYDIAIAFFAAVAIGCIAVFLILSLLSLAL